jgi:uncharacterized protein DUF5675
MTPDATITRFDRGDQGCFGRLETYGLTCYSGELPDRDNQSNLSCVLPGIYQVAWTYSPAFKRFMYLLLGTAPRAGIRKHSANLMGDILKGLKAQLNGCIALGERLGWIDGQKALLLSAPAIRRFEDHMERKPFVLEIVNG